MNILFVQLTDLMEVEEFYEAFRKNEFFGCENPPISLVKVDKGCTLLVGVYEGQSRKIEQFLDGLDDEGKLYHWNHTLADFTQATGVSVKQETILSFKKSARGPERAPVLEKTKVPHLHLVR